MPEQSRSITLTLAVDLGAELMSNVVCKAIDEACAGQWKTVELSPSGSPQKPDYVLILRNKDDTDASIKNRMDAYAGTPVVIALTIPDVSQYYSRMIELGADHVIPFENEATFVNTVVCVLRTLYKKIRLQQPEFRTKLPFAVTITDRVGRIIFWNDIAEQLFGYKAIDVCGKRAENAIPELSFINELLKKQDMTGQGEVQVKRVGGDEIICQWRARPRPMGEGLTIVFDDITNRVQVENELREAIRAADAAFRAKSEFLAVMSHEIRTPMNSIIGFTELLLDTPVDKRQRDYMEIVRANGITLLELINNVLEFSRIESGKMEVSMAPVDIAELVAGVIDSMWVEASRKGIELFSRIQDEVPQKVMAVELELRRILLNLISNGVKFTEHGSVQVFVQVLFADDKQFLLFQINDTGIGIEPDKVDRLFKTFSQVDSSSTRRFGGTGLGLAISKKLCEAMGGRMWMQSTPGKGSTFFFTMPLITMDRTELVRPDPEKVTTPQEPTALPLVDRQRQLSILVAEDEPMNQLLVKRFLSKLGQTCDLASNGLEAVEKLKENTYDLVLMDVQMPEMDGIHAAREVRSGNCGSECKDVYICALTAYAMAGDQERCIEAGMNDYLSKPLTLTSLRRAIERAIEQVFGVKQSVDQA